MHRSRRFQGIANRLKKGKDQVDVILLDFSKAFDTPPPPTHTLTSVCSLNQSIMGPEDKLNIGTSRFCSTALQRQMSSQEFSKATS